MRIRRLSKAVTGLTAGVATLCLLSFPASANTATGQINDGDLQLRNSSNGLVASVDLGDTSNQECGTNTNTLDVADVGDGVSATIVTNSAVTIAGDHWIAEMQVDLEGTRDGTDVTVVGTATATLTESTGEDSCVAASGGDVCLILAENLELSGEIDSSTLPTLQVGDTATLDGGNALGELLSGGDCGGIISINEGRAQVDDLVVEVVSVP